MYFFVIILDGSCIYNRKLLSVAVRLALSGSAEGTTLMSRGALSPEPAIGPARIEYRAFPAYLPACSCWSVNRIVLIACNSHLFSMLSSSQTFCKCIILFIRLRRNIFYISCHYHMGKVCSGRGPSFSWQILFLVNPNQKC